MKQRVCLILALVPILSLGAQELEPVIVEASCISTPSAIDKNPLEIKTEINALGIEKFSSPGKSSVYKVLDVTPGFISESLDPYGLSDNSARNRGIDSNFMSYSIEGVPNYSIRPIGPRDGIYDLENIELIEHYNGGISPQSGSGVGSKGGLINLKVKKANDKPSAQLSFGGGGNNFHRVFMRVDTGEIAQSVKTFISISHTDAQKWKGYGDLGPRKNIAFGATSTVDELPFEFLYSHNEQVRHNFRPLSYEQTKNLKQNYMYDYSKNSTANDYYDLYKKDVSYDDFQLSFKKRYKKLNYSAKVYGSLHKEKSAEGISGAGNGAGLQQGIVDASRVGFMLDTTYDFESLKLNSGVWLERSKLDKYVRRVDRNDKSIHKNWAWLNKNHGPTELISPYLSILKEMSQLKLELGLRYLDYKEAANDTYLPNNSFSHYDAAVANGVVAEGGSVEAMMYKLWLPSAGLSYKLDATTELFAKYAKGYQRPYRYSFAAQYGADARGIRTKLLAEGKTLQDIVNSWDMERSHLFDVGIKKFFEKGDFMVNFFYNRHNNLLGMAYDSRVDVDYIQNVGSANIYGLTLQGNYEPINGLWLFFNPALTYSELLSNSTYTNKEYSLKGNEVTETPRWSLKAGVSYTKINHTAMVNSRFIGSRYSDVENQKKVSGYSIVDLSYNYKLKNFTFLKNFMFELTLQNIFDTKYIASIASADLLEDTPSYFVGSPRTFTFGVRGSF